MNKNEFKLLLENWRKNLVVEGPDDVPEIDKDDLDFFSDNLFSDEENDAMSDYDAPSYSSDSEESIDGFSGMYPDDDTVPPPDESGYFDESDEDFGDVEYSIDDDILDDF